MSSRLLLPAVALIFAGFGACTLNTAGLPGLAAGSAGGATGSTSGMPVTGAGGSPSVTTASSGGQAAASASAGGTATSSASTTVTSSASSSSGGGVTCISQYGGAASYQLCKSTMSSCEFNVQLNSMTTCGAVCANLGGECLATLDNGAACEYLNTPDQLCDHKYGTAICRCSLGCGNGPPCPSGKTCTGGVCTP